MSITRTAPMVDMHVHFRQPGTGIPRTTDYEAWEFDENLDGIASVDPNKLVVFHSGRDNFRDFIGHAAGDRGLRVHLTHVNRMDQVVAVEEAKARGWRVTSDITVHHLLMNTNDRYTRSSFADMQPVLAEQVDSEQLFRAMVQRRIDAIATDHAPHSIASKLQAVNDNPACTEHEHGTRCCGMPAVQDAFPLLAFQAHIRREGFTLERAEEAYSTIPARLLGIKISPNSYVEWDMENFRISDETTVESGAGYTPFLGMMARGRVREMRVANTQIISNYQLNARARTVATGQGETI